ncbi:MAG TPA: hypothetical protein VFP20_08105 [Bacteroidales bacterium]|nr:hypothetical protein [Bacteroidales bacterium]
MKHVKSFLFLFMVLLLVACSKDESIELQAITQSEPVADPGVEYKNKMLNEYAKVLAKAVEHKEFRTLIRNRAVQKFDGDFDVLVGSLEPEMLKASDCSVKQLMRKVASDDFYLQNPTDLTTVIPNVQVSVPVHCEDWDPSTFVPMVAVLPYDYKEKPGNMITAYDSKGNVHQLSADEEPDFPVLVVGRSERVNEHGELDTAGNLLEAPIKPSFSSISFASIYPEKLILTHGFAKSLLLEWTDVENETGYEVWRMSGTTFQKVMQTSVNDNNYVDANLIANQKYWYKIRATTVDGFSSWSPVMATTASNRSDNEWLKIKRMKFSSSALKAVEGWISGAPEIRLRVVQGSVGGATNVYTSGILEPNNRGDINDVWWNREVSIFAWSTSIYGTVLTFDWREEDWLERVDFPLTGSYEDKESGGAVKVGGSIMIKNDPGGDVIGNTSVMWWQDKSQIYDLSGFQWQFAY